MNGCQQKAPKRKTITIKVYADAGKKADETYCQYSVVKLADPKKNGKKAVPDKDQVDTICLRCNEALKLKFTTKTDSRNCPEGKDDEVLVFDRKEWRADLQSSGVCKLCGPDMLAKHKKYQEGAKPDPDITYALFFEAVP